MASIDNGSCAVFQAARIDLSSILWRESASYGFSERREPHGCGSLTEDNT